MANWSELHAKADAAGKAKVSACVPVPMIVVQHVNPLNDNSPVKQAWNVPDGVCGFAGVIVKPANSSFGLWAKKNLRARKHYYGGLYLSSPLMSQSLAKNEAYCSGYAAVLKEAGINCYVDSRMD